MASLDTSVYRRIARDEPGSAQSAPAVDLSREAVRLLLALDGPLDPRAPTRYAHILNRLASIWSQAAEVDRYLAELLLTSRSGRQGFPLDVVTELMLLRGRNAKRLPPVKQDVWMEAMLRCPDISSGRGFLGRSGRGQVGLDRRRPIDHSIGKTGMPDSRQNRPENSP
jgi:hypothetical protein